MSSWREPLRLTLNVSTLKKLHSLSIRGTGLGLYISKQLVEAMGGSIWVESAGLVGQGSRFYFTLPARAFEQIR